MGRKRERSIYLNEIDALDVASQHDTGRSNLRCPSPLLRCGSSCAMYERSKVIPVTDGGVKKYEVTLGRCTNYSFVGPTELEPEIRVVDGTVKLSKTVRQ